MNGARDKAPAPPGRPPVVAVVGPTAAGKTSLSLDLAEALGGEVVNTDSMQVYRGMDIGTAKLPVAERRGIPHHLLDVLDVTEPATVAEFQQLGAAVIDDCRDRGVTPVLVGGSALYTRAVLDRFEFPGTDPAVRAAAGGASWRPRGRRRCTPGSPRWTRRRRRAIIPDQRAPGGPRAGGRRDHRSPVQRHAAARRSTSTTTPCRSASHIPRPVLDERIELRVRRMWEAGLVEEVRRLGAAGLREGRTASRALGYQQVLAFLDGDAHRGGGARADRRGHAAVRPHGRTRGSARTPGSPGSAGTTPGGRSARWRLSGPPYRPVPAAAIDLRASG